MSVVGDYYGETAMYGPALRDDDMDRHFYWHKIQVRVISVLWAIFTVCWAIMNIVVFVQPFWIGDSNTTPMSGYFGLFQYCLGGATPTLTCSGRFDDFSSIPSDAFRASAFFVFFSILMVMIVIILMFPYFCLVYIDDRRDVSKPPSRAHVVIMIVCGVLLLISALCMFLACVIYPAGWDNSLVAGLCANGAEKYQQGECTIRWAYILAIIGIFDAAILAALAFFLADRQEKLAFASHGLINGGPAAYGMGDRASISGRSIGSKRSFQPAPLAPEPTEAYNYHAEPMPLDRRTYQSKRRGSGAGSQISSSGAFYL
ncbi:LHFPL tetraspan subfamily member 3 protein-like isoform X1 [Branchiostoma floridae]|uniref:LHFPL tetraspan subfamily member 3 protein-like isoform X1 n=1 Tax=Branchiostoma floridae TaxID=7739 RepID=A0A9J7MRP3_BRAFL|nr:LHFPL tetraspan subfamily member 3 protein-like isoform X1 [Branchiostoma floridae]